MSFQQRSAALYMSKAPESAYNTPVTAGGTLGANWLRLTTQNPIIQIPQLEKRTDQGRGGSPFASKQCNGYWLPAGISIQDEANFDAAIRLSLRGVGGAVVGPTTVVALLAFKYAAAMLDPATSTQLPSTTILDAIEGSGASYLYPGAVVDSMTMSQEGANPVQIAFQLLTSGKHRSPHAVTPLPALSSFACAQPSGILNYTDPGGLVDLTTGCKVRKWSVSLANNHSPTDNRCIGDPKQVVNDYTTLTGASASPYLQKLEHGDQTVTASITILLAATLAEQVQMAENILLTNVTFGALGQLLDATAPTYESLKWIIPSANFSALVQEESNGKAAVTLNFQAITSGTSILSVEGVNGQASGVA